MFLDKFFKKNDETMSFDEIIKPEGSAVREHVIKKNITNTVKTDKSNTMENFNQMNEQENKQVSLLEKIAMTLEGLGKKEIEAPKDNSEELSKIQAELNTSLELVETLSTEKEAISKQVEALTSEKEAISLEKQELETKLAEIETLAEQERVAQAEALKKAEYIAKASEYKALAGTVEEIAAKLEKIDAIEDEELKTELLAKLKAEAEQNEVLTKEIGTAQGDAIADSEEKATKELYAKAEELASKENITVQQALNRLQQ